MKYLFVCVLTGLPRGNYRASKTELPLASSFPIILVSLLNILKQNECWPLVRNCLYQRRADNIILCLQKRFFSSHFLQKLRGTQHMQDSEKENKRNLRNSKQL